MSLDQPQTVPDLTRFKAGLAYGRQVSLMRGANGGVLLDPKAHIYLLSNAQRGPSLGSII